MLKIGFNIEGSWDGFLIDFGTVLGAPEGSKMWFSLRRGTNFAIFTYLKISYLFRPSKPRFWVPFGAKLRSEIDQDGSKRVLSRKSKNL